MNTRTNILYVRTTYTSAHIERKSLKAGINKLRTYEHAIGVVITLRLGERA